MWEPEREVRSVGASERVWSYLGHPLLGMSLVRWFNVDPSDKLLFG